jgi:hypothetical protein
MSWIPRALGALTAAYGLTTLARPEVLTRPSGLGEGPSTPVGILVRAVGVRDIANGMAMALAPAGPAQQVAVGARIASDLGDALVWGLSQPDRDARRKTIAVAVGWAALNAVGLLAARR